MLSANRIESLISFIPIFYAILLYFIIVNSIRGKKSLLILCGALILGTSLTAFISILSFFSIHILPFQYTHVQYFSPLGSLLDQALVFGLVLPLAAYLAHPLFSAVLLSGKPEDAPSNKKMGTQTMLFGIGLVLVGLGLIVTLYQLMTTQKPLILPFETGFQTAFASISQDAGRVLQSFLFGSGYGTYLTDFTRFKQAAYNNNNTLWAFTFFRSSSFILELLATTGFLGLASFLFIIFKVLKEKWFFLPLVLVIIAAFFLPFSFIMQAMFFILLGIFALSRAQQNPRKYQHTEMTLVALKRGLLSAQSDGQEARGKNSPALPVIFAVLMTVLVLTLGYYTVRFVLSDLTFQRSLVAASQNNGSQTYELQRQAISTFPYRDTYYRVFSQTNLAIANNLAASQPQGASPSAETQQTILTLIQQSINSGRTAVTISPLTAMNWNNLSSIYRSLIGFGQNADQFSILTNRQAIALDPNNPQQYINLGGIYYQLGQWEEAQRNFQIAINLKPDYANAYYNLGHALESKGDLENALVVYQTVRSLVANQKESVDQINQEIAALEQKIGAAGQTPPATDEAEEEIDEDQLPLGVNAPEQQLPERNPQIQIPGVTISPTTLPARTSPTPGAGTTTSPSPTATDN